VPKAVAAQNTPDAVRALIILMNTANPNIPSAQLIAQDVDSWQTVMANAIHTPEALISRLKLDPAALDAAYPGHRQFAVRVPEPYLSRIELGNLDDPLLKQILPVADEGAPAPAGYGPDPLAEAHANKAPGIVHKYKSRVLLIANGACAINCRYCFRRHFPYSDNRLGRHEWDQALEYVRANPDINEVILSGGDPLMSTDARLDTIISSIENIPHVTRLRIHTRLPIVIPQRITEALISRLETSRLAVIMVVHVNHANEIDEHVGHSLARLFKHGIHVLNQSVLLKGINDRVDALSQLSERLFEYKVLPYYLHILDRVSGAHHFEVSDAHAKSLMDELQGTLPGFLVPKLVREEAGAHSKTLIYP